MIPPTQDKHISRRLLLALGGVGGLALIGALTLMVTRPDPNAGVAENSNGQKIARVGNSTNSTRAFQTSWQDETQFIVESVLLDLGGMRIFASTGGQFSKDELSVATQEKRVDGKLAYAVTLNLPGGDTVVGDVVLDGSVWDPRAYAGIAEKLCQGILPVKGKFDADMFLKNLTEPTPDVLIKEDDYLATALQNNPSDPDVHVGASILLGAFALRENSGKFFTIRAELNRMTAHLAFAAALEKNSEGVASEANHSHERRLADGIHLALQNNQKEALLLLDELPESPVYAAWKRALKVRCTGDYRPLLGEPNRTWVEARETGRAGVKKLDSVTIIRSPAWKEVFGQTFEKSMGSLADWFRTLAMSPGSIAVMHLLYGQSQLLSTEILEVKDVHGKIKGGGGDEEQIVSDLNEQIVPFGARRGEQGGGVADGAKQRILDWGFWAGQGQRHICNAVVNEADMLQNVWAVEEKADDFRKTSGEIFSTLRLYPFVKVVTAVEQEDYKKSQEEARKVMMNSPQEVGPEIWNHTCYTNPNVELYVPPPHAYVNEWHRHNPPPGTAYDPLPRMNQPSLVEGAGAVDRVEELHQRAPYDRDISFNLLRIKSKSEGEPTSYEESLRVYSPIAEYDAVAMAVLANKAEDEGRDEEYKKWITKAIEVAPDYRSALGDYHRRRGEDQQAVETYLLWIDETTDLIPGETATYIVDYLESNGRGDEAERVANRVAETYSSGGLLTKALLLERRGDWEGAYVEHKKILDRYDDESALVAFLERATQPGIKDKLSASVASSMEKDADDLGVEARASTRVTFQKSEQAPDKGVYVQVDNETTRWVGLERGDIIVAVRGYQVDDWETFKYLRDLNQLEPYVTTVWRNGSYFDLSPIPPLYRFSDDLLDYSREKP